MMLEIIAAQSHDNYKNGDIIAKYDMTKVMDILMGKNRVTIRLFEPRDICPWTLVEYPRAKVKLKFSGANTGTYNMMLWKNRNRKGMS